MFACMVILCFSLVGAASGDEAAFSHARFIPRDVDLVVQVERAGALRRELEAMEAGEEWRRAMIPEAVMRVWSDFARLTPRGESELFEALLGRRMSVITRRREGEREWAVLSEVDVRAFERFSQEARAQIATGSMGFAIRRIPEQELIIAHNGTLLIAAPAARSALLHETMALVAGRGKGLPLLTDPALGETRALGAGAVRLFMRHDQPMGGWTALAASLDGARVSVRHTSKFDASPFSAPLPGKPLDYSILDGFDNFSVLAAAQPLAQSQGMSAEFLNAILLRDAMSVELRRQLGERLLWIVGEADGRLERPARDDVMTAFGIAIELKSTDQFTAARIDRVMRALAGSLMETAGEAGALAWREPESPESIRTMALPGVGRTLLPGVPGHDAFALSWQLVSGEERSWWLLASHRGHLVDMARVLGQPALAGEPRLETGRVVASGHRAADHLRGLRPMLHTLTDQDDRPRIETSVQRLIDLAQGIESFDWRLARDTRHELRGEIIIRLRAASVVPDEPASTLPPSGGKPDGHKPRRPEMCFEPEIIPVPAP